MADEAPETGEDQVPRFARFGGILEGRCDSPDGLREALDTLNRTGVVRGELEIDGPRFAFTFEEEWVDGKRLARRDAFVDSLRELVRRASPDRPVESTLHCCEVFEDEAIETIFGIRRGDVSVRSRSRPLVESERGGLPPALARRGLRGPLKRFGIVRTIIVGVALIALVGLATWREGYVGRVFGPEAVELQVEPGVMENRIAIEVVDSLGNYTIRLRRGPAYPSTAEAARRWEEEAGSIEERALRQGLTSGSALYLRLLDADGKVMEAVSISLRPLLNSADGVVEASLPGRLGARAIDLSPSAGTR